MKYEERQRAATGAESLFRIGVVGQGVALLELLQGQGVADGAAAMLSLLLVRVTMLEYDSFVRGENDKLRALGFSF